MQISSVAKAREEEKEDQQMRKAKDGDLGVELVRITYDLSPCIQNFACFP
jgi:hypothetical protein